MECIIKEIFKKDRIELRYFSYLFQISSLLRRENLIFLYAENVASPLFASQLLMYPLNCMINMNYSAKRKLDFVKDKQRSIEKKFIIN